MANDFSAPLGLMVNSGNRNLPMSRINALDILMKYFGKEVPAKTKIASLPFTDVKKTSRSYVSLQKACALGILSCEEGKFRPFESVSPNDFLDWFFRLKYLERTKALEEKYPNVHQAASQYWMEARKLGLMSGMTFTAKTVQDFLYRHSVSEANLGLPFSEALVLDAKDITAENFHNLREIERMQEGIRFTLSGLESKKSLTVPEKAFAEKLNGELKAFDSLKASLAETPHVLSGRSDFNSQVTQLVKHFGLQEILSTYSYDYSKNPAYRQYNLVTGINKMQGKLLMPGEILDYWQLISDKNLWDFKYGWVIAGGVEKWEFGGGICGSATMAFIPLWKAGLEIVERRNHSIFYSDLYPKDHIGLDATVYRPKPNLRLRNNLETPLVFNVVNDTQKKIITVEVIGNRTYKTATFEGPIFSGKKNVKWVRQLEGFDGTIATETVESRYNAIH